MGNRNYRKEFRLSPKEFHTLDLFNDRIFRSKTLGAILNTKQELLYIPKCDGCHKYVLKFRTERRKVSK